MSLVHGAAVIAATAILTAAPPAAAEASSPAILNGGGHASAAGGPPGGARPGTVQQHPLGRPRSGGTALPDAPAGYPVTGIDVSSHDHGSGKTVDWPGLAASGIKFAYVKATEGTSYTNPYFASDYNSAKGQGIYVGAYAFGRPDLGNPVGQADHFYDRMQWTRDGRTLPPFVDMEWPWFSGVNSCYNLTPGQITSWLHAFLDRLQARTGQIPMIYTAASWWNPCTASDTSFGKYFLDVADCRSRPALPAGWSTWTIWQYNIPDGCSAPRFDEDVLNDKVTSLAALASGEATPPAAATQGRRDPTPR
ncbi:GH25 family lysozyme [Planosporangium sp. 12N6]|uniref:GH25 family lysozyme n=1 Tax=Planosporangium spinosum TaxID=3402278 RepID=UPI003CF6E01B